MTTAAHDIAIELDQLTRFAPTHIKLEITGGTRTWRRKPSIRHQKLIDRIRQRQQSEFSGRGRL